MLKNIHHINKYFVKLFLITVSIRKANGDAWPASGWRLDLPSSLNLTNAAVVIINNATRYGYNSILFSSQYPIDPNLPLQGPIERQLSKENALLFADVAKGIDRFLYAAPGGDQISAHELQQYIQSADYNDDEGFEVGLNSKGEEYIWYVIVANHGRWFAVDDQMGGMTFSEDSFKELLQTLLSEHP
ncbi:hypothetical protein LRP52_35890 [Photobacterium sp. ZSDE20]|uniref:Uncharacterized protein n=1 Tax=Photobacterium pectinilyticum TaxID=2906793 RepID=A0ABT1N5V3_9GAMM|nr:hypothetical protein [Photobacterium sp. ZSDE20]MCQ1060111.1 hypothetical protein [Photobacterium sp. ZSDE20]MDD1827567.1 hypothetical protein [Photobacterium sp. ZSDE20]